MNEDGDGETGSGDAAPVFISSASQNAAVADKIRAALEAAGVVCWIAPRDVHAGQSYAAAIVAAINSCRMLLLLLSQSAIESPHVLREVERASSKRRPILAVRRDDAKLPPDLEYFLSANQWLDAVGRPIEQILPAVVESVRAVDGGSGGRDSRRAENPITNSTPSSVALPAARKPALHWGLRMMAAVAVAGVGYFAVERLILSKRVAAVEATATDSANALALGALPEKSVAVLPFVNLGGESNDTYLGDGISGEILSALSRLPGLKVIGRASSFQFRDHDVDAVKVGKALSVRSLLTGTV